MKRAGSLSFSPSRGDERGSVLIIVMWICLGPVTLTLYFASSMNSELRAADNRINETAARQAIAAGTRYAAYVLKEFAAGGVVPDLEDYRAEALSVGDASFWFIGRDSDVLPTTQAETTPRFALVDEASKLNLNTATAAMLQALPLPDMTPEFAAAIVAWRSTGQAATAADNTYTQLTPARHNKGAVYETVDELRLVDGAMLDLILGEDTNRNGVLDANEDDGETSTPRDDQNGQLLAGLWEYVTVYSSEPATTAAGTRRINLATLNMPATRTQVQTLLTGLGVTQQRAQQILQPYTAANAQPPTSVADFMLTSNITEDEFVLVHSNLTFYPTTNTTGVVQGLVNVNTASVAVLGALPGIGADNAATLVAARQSLQRPITSFFWIKNVLPAATIRTAGVRLTDQSYQFTADIAAVGNNGRGYCREKVVFDTTAALPRIVYRQDLTGFGWALGATTKTNLQRPKDS